MLSLAPYVGTGTRKDPFRPRAAEGNWSAVDLRPDASVVDGFALLHHPSTSSDPLLRAIGSNKNEARSRAMEISLGNVLGKTFDGKNRSIADLVGDLLIAPPSVKGWNPLQPARLQNGSRILEVWLNGEQWFLQPVLAGGSSVTDNFNRANENPLAAPWTKAGVGNTFTLTSNQLTATGSPSDSAYYYAAAAATADQYSEIQAITLPTNSDWGSGVRISGTGAIDGYFFLYYSGAGARTFFKNVAGTFTQLSGSIDTDTAGDYVKSVVSGSTLTQYRDTFTTPTTSRSTVTDTSITTGQPGVFQFEVNGAFDNFRGGDGNGTGGGGVVVDEDARWFIPIGNA